MDMPEEVLEIFREEAGDLLRAAMEGLEGATRAGVSQRQAGWVELKRALHTLKGAAAVSGQDHVEQAVHAIEDMVDQEEPPEDRAVLDPVFTALDVIASLLEPSPVEVSLPESPPLHQEPGTPPEPASEPQRDAPTQIQATPVSPPAQGEGLAQRWLRIPPRRIDQLEAQVGELVLARLREEQVGKRLGALRGLLDRGLSSQRQLQRALSESRRVLPAEHFVRLRTHVQELSAGLGQFQSEFGGLCRDAPQLQAQSTLVSQGVEESIQSLRLMPLKPFLEGFATTARDAARRTGKQLRFEVDADDAEIDRSILLVLQDALLHIVRNAIVHGIEMPDARASAGKDPYGTLRLWARSSGNHAEVRVHDDGGGVDEARVRAKAAAAGVAGAERAELLDLLTHSGLSTQDQADDLAGRGVGLDVSMSTLRALDGSIELRTEPGQSTTFCLTLPVRASTGQGLLLEMGERSFGILQSSVERVLLPEPADYRDLDGQLALDVDGEAVSVTWLADLVGMSRPRAAPARPPVVVLEHGRRRLGVIVDELPGESAMVIRPFGRAFRRADLFVGGAVQPDHSVVPVLSVGSLFARAARSRAPQRSELPTLPKERAQEHYALVVDDSITMRTLIRNILDAAGYHVTTAEDGRAALEVLAGMTRCDVVVTDLQMPHLNGIELCAAIRARDAAYVPIIMVNSVADDDERRRALTAGADAYVVKASFEQGHFLHRVDTLVHGPTGVSA